MENVLKSIEKQVEKLREKANSIELKIESREDSFNNKSEKWQESEKGELHQEETDRLQDLFDELIDKIENIEFAVQEIRDLL